MDEDQGKKSRIITVRVPSQLYERLGQLARENRRTLADFVRIVLEDTATTQGKQERQQ